ncbi:MAG: 16S rRNA processing protein RimM [Rhodospirillaceae bacterium]|nr:16S rRNA processing protein RimM [Rhodospirillaceae bacterium]
MAADRSENRGLRICLGVIVGAKGIKGEVRIKSFTEDPFDVGSYGPVESEDGANTWTVKVVGESKGAVTALLKGVTDRNQAEALKGQKLYVDRDKLPAAEAGTYYHADLVGLKAVLNTGEGGGEEIGSVLALYNFGAGDIIEVGHDQRDSTMVPFSDDAVVEVNIEGGFIRIEPLPGLFDDGDEDEAANEEEGDNTGSDDTAVKRRE